ncbi:MAG: hypothetical protein MUP81_06390 [Dehalococcoidia bacterium]|nr:hypothetical protein [Dehalococcoidia bacterium]
MKDLIASFEEFLLRQNPNTCLVCWGQGKLVATLPMTGLKHEIECFHCKGIGEIKQSESSA